MRLTEIYGYNLRVSHACGRDHHSNGLNLFTKKICLVIFLHSLWCRLSSKCQEIITANFFTVLRSKLTSWILYFTWLRIRRSTSWKNHGVLKLFKLVLLAYECNSSVMLQAMTSQIGSVVVDCCHYGYLSIRLRSLALQTCNVAWKEGSKSRTYSAYLGL